MVSTAAFHARVRGSVPGLGGLKKTKLFLPHPRVKVSIAGSLRDREVACSASNRQGSNFESCVWRTVSSQSSHHPQEVLLAQFSLYVHKGGLKPDSFHFLFSKFSKYLSLLMYHILLKMKPEKVDFFWVGHAQLRPSPWCGGYAECLSHRSVRAYPSLYYSGFKKTLPLSVVKFQCCGTHLWPRSSVHGPSSPGREFWILCLFHVIHLTIPRSFFWSNLACICAKVACSTIHLFISAVKHKRSRGRRLQRWLKHWGGIGWTFLVGQYCTQDAAWSANERDYIYLVVWKT